MIKYFIGLIFIVFISSCNSKFQEEISYSVNIDLGNGAVNRTITNDGSLAKYIHTRLNKELDNRNFKQKQIFVDVWSNKLVTGKGIKNKENNHVRHNVGGHKLEQSIIYYINKTDLGYILYDRQHNRLSQLNESLFDISMIIDNKVMNVVKQIETHE